MFTCKSIKTQGLSLIDRPSSQQEHDTALPKDPSFPPRHLSYSLLYLLPYLFLLSPFPKSDVGWLFMMKMMMNFTWDSDDDVGDDDTYISVQNGWQVTSQKVLSPSLCKAGKRSTLWIGAQSHSGGGGGGVFGFIKNISALDWMNIEANNNNKRGASTMSWRTGNCPGWGSLGEHPGHLDDHISVTRANFLITIIQSCQNFFLHCHVTIDQCNQSFSRSWFHELSNVPSSKYGNKIIPCGQANQKDCAHLLASLGKKYFLLQYIDI